MALVCPHCKMSTSFNGIVRKKAVISTNSDQPYIEKTNDDNYEVILESCAVCGLAVKSNQLREAEYCAQCNEIVDKASMLKLEDGTKVCPACHAKETRNDIANMSQQQLIMRLLELERAAKK